MVAMRIEKRGSKWVVLPESGDRVLGEHDTKEEAEAQLRAIEASKHRASRLFSVGSFRFSLGDLSSAIGKWSRGATYGVKVKDGERIPFTAETLGQMVRNAAARGDKVAICQDHKSAFVSTTGQPAPSLGFFYALAVFDKGTLVEHWSRDGGEAPAGTDANGNLRDGLYCRLGEITPLGADPTGGLANYSGISPMFGTEDFDEHGNPIGFALMDFGATSTPFQSGCELQFHRPDDAHTMRLDGNDENFGYLRNASSLSANTGAARAFSQEKKPMPLSDEEMMAKLGLAADAVPDAMKGAFKKYMEEAEAKFAAAVPVEEEHTMGGEKTGPQTAENKNKEGENAAIHVNTGNVHDESGRKASREVDAAKFAALEASNRALMARLASVEAAEKARQDAATADRNREIEALADAAVAGGYPKESRGALVTFAGANLDEAHKMAAPFLPKTGVPGHLFQRLSSQGAPIGKAGDARTVAAPRQPTVRETPFGTVVSADEAEADEIKALAFSKDPAQVAKVDAHLSENERGMNYLRLLAARKVLMSENPERFKAERDKRILMSVGVG